MLSKNARICALIAALIVPLGLLHAFVLAEIGIAITDLLFLSEMARTGNFAWVRKPWFIISLVWWLWLVVCSIPWVFFNAGWQLAFVQALVIIRFIVFAAALQNWVLTTPASRRAAWIVIALSCLWIGLESWQQYLTGRNIFGNRRWGDGSLTGPFWKPRAGALYAHLLFVALLPPVMALFARPGQSSRICGIALAILGVVTSVLIGQRMGTALMGLGLLTAALFIPQLRRVAAIAAAVGILVLLAAPIISPPTYNKLVGETTMNMSHFALSPYGELYTRAATMGMASPIHGWGYNGFRAFCPQPQFGGGFPALGIAPTELALAACNLHPHNFYFQAFADAGYPGLFLFSLMALAWLVTLGRGLWKQPAAVRVGLFIAVLTFAWPFGSTDEFPALYMSGWLFFLLGLGLSHAQITMNLTLLEPQNA